MAKLSAQNVAGRNPPGLAAFNEGEFRRGDATRFHQNDLIVRLAQAAASNSVHRNAARAPTAKPQPHWKPTSTQVLNAVLSLYADRLKPFGRILLKRVRELEAEAAAQKARAGGDPSAVVDIEAVPLIDPKCLRRICETSTVLRVEPEDGKEYSVSVVGKTADFVDVSSAEDPYPEALWQEVRNYFESLQGEDMLLPGGRYACAQVLLSRKVPFVQGLCLGELCHIVQLAVSQKRLLGYWEGSMVPFGRSADCIKEQCAAWQQPVIFKKTVAPNLPLATWDQARACLWDILESCSEGGSPGTVTISNIKRLFRSKFNLELSETALGHSRLNELLQDPRMSDVCRLELQGKSQVVVQRTPSQPYAAVYPWATAAAAASIGMEPMIAASPAQVEYPIGEVWPPNENQATERLPPTWAPGLVPPQTMMSTASASSLLAMAAAARGHSVNVGHHNATPSVVGMSHPTPVRDAPSLNRADYRVLLHGYAKKLISEGYTAQEAYATLLNLTQQVRAGHLTMSQALAQAGYLEGAQSQSFPPAGLGQLRPSGCSRRSSMPTISEGSYGLSEEEFPDVCTEHIAAKGSSLGPVPMPSPSPSPSPLPSLLASQHLYLQQQRQQQQLQQQQQLFLQGAPGLLAASASASTPSTSSASTLGPSCHIPLWAPSLGS